jgi:hypothetical protein
MADRNTLTGAEAVALVAALVPASTIVLAYLVDLAGWAFGPFVMIPATLAAGALALAVLLRRAAWRLHELTALVAIVGVTFARLLWIARPSFLPLGTGPDLTHHLLLIQYIERNWRLVHDAGIEAFLGEMIHYTPGSHILVALAGRWSGTSGLHAVHTVVSAAVALKVGFIFLIAMRVLGQDARDRRRPAPDTRQPSADHAHEAVIGRLPFAVLASLLLFGSPVYFLQSFLAYSFFAQVVSELFAVVMWWALLVWHGDNRRAPVAVFGLTGAAAVLTWPVWIGPPLMALAGLTVVQGISSLAARGRDWQAPVWRLPVDLAVALAPIVLIATLYISVRPGWLHMAGTGGTSPWPDASAYGGWLLLAAAIAGVLPACLRREGIATIVLVVAISAQMAGLLALARIQQANAPYLALKMFYLLLYPQAVLTALAVASAWMWVARLVARVRAPLWAHAAQALIRAAAWLPAAAAVLAAATTLATPHAIPGSRRSAVSRPLELAGLWARANVPAGCVEYLVSDPETAYWLHLAVLGNPRMSARTGDNATYDLQQAVVRWLTPGGLPYAIADLSALSRDVAGDLDVVARFETSAVARRRGESACPAR